jgi:hypothetical protein
VSDLSRLEEALQGPNGDREVEVERVEEGLAFTLRGVRGHLGSKPQDFGSEWPLHCRAHLLDPWPRFELDLRPRTRDELRTVERGEAVDLDLGDPVFARRFLAEVAPADVARKVIDAQVRAAMVALSPCRMTLEAGVVHLAAALGPDEARARAMVALCVAVVERIARAGATLDLEPRRSAGGERGRGGRVSAAALQRGVPYREATISTRTPEDERRAERELAELRDARRLRAQVEGFPLGAALIVTLVAAAMIAMSWH